MHACLSHDLPCKNHFRITAEYGQPTQKNLMCLQHILVRTSTTSLVHQCCRYVQDAPICDLCARSTGSHTYFQHLTCAGHHFVVPATITEGCEFPVSKHMCLQQNLRWACLLHCSLRSASHSIALLTHSSFIHFHSKVL